MLKTNHLIKILKKRSMQGKLDIMLNCRVLSRRLSLSFKRFLKGSAKKHFWKTFDYSWKSLEYSWKTFEYSLKNIGIVFQKNHHISAWKKPCAEGIILFPPFYYWFMGWLIDWLIDWGTSCWWRVTTVKDAFTRRLIE